MLAARPQTSSLKMRRAASRLAALAARQQQQQHQRLMSNALASSSRSAVSCTGSSSSSLMQTLNPAVVSKNSMTTFRRRLLHSAAALGSEASPGSNLSSLRASRAAETDDKDEDDTGIEAASDDGGGSPSLSSPSSPSSPSSSSTRPPPPRQQGREPDFTQLAALAASLAARAVPGRVDDVVGVDEATVALKLRVKPLAEVVPGLNSSSSNSSSCPSSSSSSPYELETAWLWVCWKAGAARACLGPEPPRGSPADGFASTARLREELRGRVLSSAALRRRWERVLVLAFSSRRSEAAAGADARAGGGEERGTYGDEGQYGEEDDPYSPRDAAAKNKNDTKMKKNNGAGASENAASAAEEEKSRNDLLPAPDRLLFLEVMGRRSNMALTEVDRAKPTKGGAEFALAAAEAAALNEAARRKLLLREKKLKGKAGGSTKRGKRGAVNAAAAEALAALEKQEEEEAAAAEAAAAASSIENNADDADDALTSFLPLPPGVKPDTKRIPKIPRPTRIPSFYAASPAAAAAAASYPPTAGAEAASLGISGDATSAFSSSSSSSAEEETETSSSSSARNRFSVPRLIPPAASARAGKILALGRSVPPSASQRRPLAVGKRYSPPPGLLSQLGDTGGGGGRLAPGMSETRQVWRANILGAAAAVREARREGGERAAAKAEAEVEEAEARARAEAEAEAEASLDGNETFDAAAATVAATTPRKTARPLPVVPLATALVQAYGGVSPQLAQELCWAAGIRGNGAAAAATADFDVERVSEEDWKKLHAVWRNWLCAVADARFAPGRDHQGMPSVLGGGVLFESRGDFAAPSVPCDVPSLLAAAAGVDAALRETLADDGKKGGSQDLLRDVTRATAKALARARGALAALEKNAAKSLDADATRHRADLLTANIHLISPGDTSVEVDCWETGQKVVLDLTEGSSTTSSSSSSSSSSSPGRTVLLDPPDLAALLYRKARKQRRAEEGTAPRRAQADETIALLEGVEARLAEIAALASSAEAEAFAASCSSGSVSETETDRALPGPSADLLLSIRDELVAWGHMKPPKDAAAATKAASRARKAEKSRSGSGGSGGGKEESGEASWSSLPASSPSSSVSTQRTRNTARPFRRFVSPGGFEVLLGRNNRENDELSLRVAGADDLWLHARGVPGSHAVLRVPSSMASSSSSDLPAEDLEFAAALAAFFSKARDGGKVPVTFTRARNVKKPKGAPPGLVTLMSEKVVSVRPESVASVVASAGSGAEASGSESEGEVA